MRVRWVEIDATPEELARADIRTLLRQSQLGAVPFDHDGTDGNLPPEVQELINSVPLNRKSTVEGFLAKILRWDDVEARRGISRKGEGGMTQYIRLHRRGSAYGAFAYVRPHRLKVTLRIGKEAAQGLSYAQARDVRSKNPYQVKIYLRSPEALEEALSLARSAYENLAS